jgi:hypothetical protein
MSRVSPSLFAMKYTLLLLLTAAAASAHAASIAIPNASFEEPATANYTLIADDDNAATGTWLKYNAFGAVINATSGGNPWNYTPAGIVGQQYGNLEAKGGGLFMDTAAYDGTGAADLYWRPGTYTLTVGVFGRIDNQPSASSAFSLNLFKRDTRTTGLAVLATTTVTASQIRPDTLTDISLRLDVPEGAAYSGQPIGIWFQGLGGASGDWGYDNVRLDYVPEPGSGMLVLTAAAGLLRRRRR